MKRAARATFHGLIQDLEATAPLLERYRRRDLLTTVKGEGAIDEIRAAVRRAAEARR